MGGGGEVFFFQVNQPPLTDDGKPLHIEDNQAVGLQFHIQGNPRNQSDAEASRHTMLDGAVIAHLHADVQLYSSLPQSEFQG